MGSSERILSGRASRPPVDPWGGQAVPWRVPNAAVEPERRDPMQDEAVIAQIVEAKRLATEHGYADGRQIAEQEFVGVIASAQTLARTLETAVPRDVEMVARTIAELAVLISRRILAAELRHDPAVLIAAIEAGLRQAAGASVITVELNPSAVELVETAWTARHGARHRGFSWSFSADPLLPPGGCRLRTEHGFVEAGFEDQLAEVAAALDASIPGYISSALGPTAEQSADATSRAGSDRSAAGAASRRAARAAGPASAPTAEATGAAGSLGMFDAPGMDATDGSPAAAQAGSPAADDLDLAALAGGGISAEDLASLGLLGGELA